ncbi:methyltransferase domain-containing protein [Roseibium denhamense]|uniref:Methyltransferase domain-containing protein n=1 Tax=Roseibium denhamense TaxID=76305 RepID=A0ABY1NTK2_9HYPH|nr:methyltransferase domain-containing protein [Roseibium denhamense]MTI05383.1 methyltransferase domain-containing protein [Roseibium denhamense]SMP17605.1 Methyltransferase domain-containing protein [Roseibium denhamense]
MLSKIKHISTRRKVLRDQIDVVKSFKQWEETCVPSYCHNNLAAAYVSWIRLFTAVEVARACVPDLKRIVDFGASVGELSHIIGADVQYDFIEQDELAASMLTRNKPDAVRRTLEDAAPGGYDAVFAIDSLEHNTNFEELLKALSKLLAPNGVLVLSGPTENELYRFGRKLAGFEGDYHVTTIYEIEAAADKHLQRTKLRRVPLGVPLFRITAWKHRSSSSAG